MNPGVATLLEACCYERQARGDISAIPTSATRVRSSRRTGVSGRTLATLSARPELSSQCMRIAARTTERRFCYSGVTASMAKAVRSSRVSVMGSACALVHLRTLRRISLRE